MGRKLNDEIRMLPLRLLKEKKQKKVCITLSVDTNLDDNLKSICKALDMNRVDLLKQLIEYGTSVIGSGLGMRLKKMGKLPPYLIYQGFPKSVSDTLLRTYGTKQELEDAELLSVIEVDSE